MCLKITRNKGIYNGNVDLQKKKMFKGQSSSSILKKNDKLYKLKIYATFRTLGLISVCVVLFCFEFDFC